MTISILERVLSDEISANEALAEWPSIDEETVDLIAKAWHELTQFAADADLRARDSEYAQYQRDQLLNYLDRLKSNLSR